MGTEVDTVCAEQNLALDDDLAYFREKYGENSPQYQRLLEVNRSYLTERSKQ